MEAALEDDEIEAQLRKVQDVTQCVHFEQQVKN
jgi:hypothetical protein